MDDVNYAQALELQPGDKHALVCRSRCRLQMGDMAGALADAEDALNKDPNYVKGSDFFFILSRSL